MQIQQGRGAADGRRRPNPNEIPMDRTGNVPRDFPEEPGHDPARARMKPTELSIREWARHDSDVAARAHRVDRARMAYMHELFLAVTGDEQEAAALAAVSVGVWLASHLMRFDVSGYGHDDVLQLVFERTTLADSPAKTLTMGTTHAPA